jgi:hypothetical protein
MPYDQRAQSSYRIGGYRDSKEFFKSKGLHKAGLCPVLSTFSAAVRLVSNVALAVFNLLKTIVYGFVGLGQAIFTNETDLLDHASDSFKALLVNIGACVFSIIEAIPIVGNMPHWAVKCYKKATSSPYSTIE